MDNQRFFDQEIDRRRSNSLKWDTVSDSAIPMWIADMDFALPEEILEALKARLKHPILGYSIPSKRLNAAVSDWVLRRYFYKVDPSEIEWIPNITSLIEVIARAFALEGKKLIISKPLFSHILTAARSHQSAVLEVPMIMRGDRWEFDFETLALINAENGVFFLCNPHNPTGRVFEINELQKLAEISERKGWLVVSDEVFSDMVFEGHHIPFASLNNWTRDNSVTIMGPAKAFNLAGLPGAFYIIHEKVLRDRIASMIGGVIQGVGALSFVAFEAAYTCCEPWLSDLQCYLESNRNFLIHFLSKNIPELSLLTPQATYLAWIDTSPRNANDVVTRARDLGVVVSNGLPHGSESHIRFNFGCPRKTLADGLARLQQSFLSLK
jgi:cystathionine beta-lyase